MRRLLLALMLGVLVWTVSYPVAVAPAGAGSATLERYRFKLFLRVELAEDGEVLSIEQHSEGEVIEPDRYHVVCRASSNLFGLPVDVASESIGIGDRQWVKDTVTGRYEARRDTGCGSEESPSDLLKDFPTARVVALPATEETVNGVATVRYHLDRRTPNGDALIIEIMEVEPDALGPESEVSLDYWAAKDTGWPIKLTLVARNFDDIDYAEIMLDIFDANAPDIRIEAP
jgi:hypothetical protein